LSTLAGVSGAVLEDVRLAVDREDDRAFVGVGLVERSDPSPDEFACAADAVVVIERLLRALRGEALTPPPWRRPKPPGGTPILIRTGKRRSAMVMISRGLPGIFKFPFCSYIDCTPV
jgi:hypothetical protein